MSKKLIFLVFIFIFILSACSANSSIRNEKSIVENYNNLILNSKKESEIVKFLDENISKVSQENADSMIIKFKEFYEKNLYEKQNEFFQSNVQEELIKVSKYNFDINNIENIKDPKVKALVDNTINYGYKIINAEGSFIPIVNYEYLTKYNPFISDEIKDYLKLFSTESNNMSALDAGIIISLDDVSKRALDSEKYLKKYPNSIVRKDIKNLYKYYMELYIKGLDNTPIFDFKTNKIREDILDSYKKTISNNKNSIISNILTKYIDIIKNENYYLTENVIEFQNNYYNNIEKEIDSN